MEDTQEEPWRYQEFDEYCQDNDITEEEDIALAFRVWVETITEWYDHP